ncbi:MAG: His/Gly/Thr/Pro-type tRNA ligase C-terminal domain-containing protein [Heyndrickxia sp.]
MAILGEDEIKANKVVVKNMENGEQVELSISDFISEFERLA